MTIRPFQPERDYPAVAAALSAAYPSYPFTPERLRARDESAPAHCLRGRWVAEEGGAVLGAGGYEQRADMYAPGRYEVQVHVLPDRQRQGIGGRLYGAVSEALSLRSPSELRAFCLETDSGAIGFLTRRGFVQTRRDGQASLDLAAFDSDGWPSSKKLPPGIHIVSFADIADDPGFATRLCALHNAVMADVPPIGVRTPLAQADFVRLRLDPSDKLLEGSFAAVGPDGGLVGLSELRRAPDGSSSTLHVGLTGVVRSWRGRGIGLALKLAAIRWAKESGCVAIRTGNDADNIPILRLNARLGFVRDPWRLHFVRNAPDI